MGIATGVLERLRELVYRGRLREWAVERGVDVRLGECYWAVYRLAAGTEQVVRVGAATATFTVSTYPEYHVVNAVRGAERPVVERLLEALAPDDVLWDVGANVGTFSCLAGSVLTGGMVVAFEPYPPNTASLRRNLAANDVEAIVKSCALSDAPGHGTLLVLDTREAGTLRGSIVSGVAAEGAAIESLEVDVTTGDRLVAEGEVPAPTVVKLDIEGAAPDVLDGMVDTIRHPACRLVVVEPHDNSARIERRLLDAGFHVDAVRLAGDRRGEPPTLVASTSDDGALDGGR